MKSAPVNAELSDAFRPTLPLAGEGAPVLLVVVLSAIGVALAAVSSSIWWAPPVMPAEPLTIVVHEKSPPPEPVTIVVHEKAPPPPPSFTWVPDGTVAPASTPPAPPPLSLIHI